MASRCRDANLSEKLAAMIVAHFEIPREIAKGMTARQILALVDWDHAPVQMTIGLDIGWTPEEINHPTNLQPLLSPDHSAKTAATDIPAIRKADRITEKHEAFRRAVLAKSGRVSESVDEKPKRKSHWPSRKLRPRPWSPRRDP